MTEIPEEKQGKQAEVECPKCKHKFLHRMEESLKSAGDALGNAIGEAKFGE